MANAFKDNRGHGGIILAVSACISHKTKRLKCIRYVRKGGSIAPRLDMKPIGNDRVFFHGEKINRVDGHIHSPL